MTEDVWSAFALSDHYDGFLQKIGLYQAMVNSMVWAMASAARVLDNGCGTGNIAIPLARAGKEVYGIDVSEGMLQVARRKRAREDEATQQRLHFELGDAQHISLGDGTFDGVLSNNVIFTVPNPLVLLQEAHRVLRPGGVLAISGPNQQLDYARLMEHTVAELKAKWEWGEGMEKQLEGFMVMNRRIAEQGGIRNIYRGAELERILLDDVGFSVITHSDESHYLGQNYFIVAER